MSYGGGGGGHIFGGGGGGGIDATIKWNKIENIVKKLINF